MLAAWNGMTEAQGTVIAAFLTIAAAVVGVLLGAWLFGGRVKSLEEAVQQTERLLQAHKAEVEATLGGLRRTLTETAQGIDQLEATLAELRQTLTTTVEGIGQLRGAVSEIPTSGVPVPEEQAGEWVRWEQLRDDWNSVRDELERRAADPVIDGRTRAKYGRIDRRKYYELIDALDADRNLAGQGRYFRQANELWQQFKNGRRIPSQAVLAQMRELKRRLVGEAA
jgi:hypothetical protein